jgi:hypothetical protein
MDPNMTFIALGVDKKGREVIPILIHFLKP